MGFYRYPQLAAKADDALFDQSQAAGSSAPRGDVDGCPVCSGGAGTPRGHGAAATGHHAHVTGTAPAHWRLLAPLCD